MLTAVPDQILPVRGGRYVCPWRKEKVVMGNYFCKAVQHFLGQERRWLKNPKLKEKSDDLIKKYSNWDHMQEALKGFRADTSGEVYYIPYLSVIRKNVIITRIRNVFNASSPSSNGVSFSYFIIDTVIRSRKFRYV